MNYFIAFLVEAALKTAIEEKAEFTVIGFIDGEIHTFNTDGQFWEIR